ncbi:hypothetical protein A5787_03260 [Mycobacterium sp. 852002-50816_SCH5313054-b]|uniref:ParB/RepB/Spo0J family partition protein n=1 Tax=Mycobacterium sp. 852002-50816_SCH5313054-b TaxID=1834092 RepID=UPI0007FD7FB4|nr:ParB/RepB/Spo0J family partition protein [Mycobacterium sp. 852002-50816_SCH5313054-b]OBF55323.1 hypothetical protein A5787_03260 [Mycobacterium sp. 852002-50816_SCH5313054-b]
MGTHDDAATVLPGLRQERHNGESLSWSLPTSGAEAIGGRPVKAITKIRIASLVRAESPRSGGEDRAHVQLLREAEGPWPPILVHRATMQIVDGFHRVAAAVEKGLDEIEAILIDEPWESAFLIAVRANVTHGLPLSLADRRAAAAKIVLTHSEFSDRAIAAIAGLSARTVREIRSSSADAPRFDKRVGRDGRIRPLNAAVGRQLAADYLASHPDASLREIAAAVGISPGTARDVRARVTRGDDPVPAAPVENRDMHRRLGFTQPRSAAPDEKHPADVSPVLATLAKDPALRMNDTGRELLRWLRLHAVNSIDIAMVVESVPDYCVEHLVQLATRCSANWARIAHDLAQCSHERHCANAGLPGDEPGVPAEQCS